MSGRGPAILGGLAALLALFLLVQLSGRANLAYDASAPIRRDMRQVTVLFDRAALAGVLTEGWSAPVPGQGATSNGPAPSVLLPTSTAAGDVALTLVVASVDPALADRPVRARIGETTIAVWTPRGAAEKTLDLTVPAKARVQSYQLAVTFDAPGPIRIVSASTRIVRPAERPHG